MLLNIIIFFLALSLVFYCLFGGADFGAGILELITARKNREQVSHAIGPVWEANHVWLILVVVILFMGFPKIYSTISLYLHIPIVLFLIGIILRGTAFSFMHYDAIKDRSNMFYNWIFTLSSVITPIFLGMIVGAVILGDIDPHAESFSTAFIAPWLNGFSFSVGLFTLCLFTFLAAVFMVGEARDLKDKQVFIDAAQKVQLAAVLSGVFVFIAAYWYEYPLLSSFLNSWVAVICIVLATVSLGLVWWFLHREMLLLSRVAAGLQVLLILTGWFWIQYPVVVNLKGEEGLTFANTAAPDATMLQLVLALVIGSGIILPFLYYLMKIFKGSQFLNTK